MHRNTAIFISVLAVFAALVAGVNIGKSLRPIEQAQQNSKSQTTPSQAVSTTPTFSPVKTYTSPCGFQVQYPSFFTLTEESSIGAMLKDDAASDSIIMACQKNIPRPAIPASSIDTILIHVAQYAATISAKLYHDKSAQDGAPTDAFIFKHPKSKLDIFIAGYGPQFNDVIKTLTIE